MFFKPEDKQGATGKKQMPALPLRDIVVFPNMVTQLYVGREKSITALEQVMSRDKEVFLVAQHTAKTNDPGPEDVYSVGTVGVVVQLLRLADGTVKVLVEGKRRAAIKRFVDTREFFAVEVEDLPTSGEGDAEVVALGRNIVGTFEMYVKLQKKVQPDVLVTLQGIEDTGKLADAISSNLPTLKLADRQSLLEATDVKERLSKLYELMQGEIEILHVEKRIRSRVKRQMERTQKEYYLNEQMQAIQRELGGERDELKSDLQEIEEKLREKKLSEECKTKVERELKKLRMMHPTSAEATVVRNYVDWLVALPWGEKSTECHDIAEAEKVLDEDHYGLRKCKERIVEYLAVQALTKHLKGPILCFVGPPGVGKTSLARSIARATGRKFVRVSLGGVRDEAEIRGHRRTYIGALPGKIIQSLKKVGTDNPVFLLDEIDKMSTDFRGDPASALLEVLDPEQNTAFNDHYLDVDYDLSDVMFLTTANSLGGIPVPLRDRMEIIELSSYTELEKLNIARKYLVPRQKAECGLADVPVEVGSDALRTLIHHYTKEAGVRSLERELASVFRKLALKVVKEGTTEGVAIHAKDIPGYLGVPKYRLGQTEDADSVGLTHGLSVSDYGGDILDCEVSVVAGKGKLAITGLLEKGMEESAQAAMSYIRSRAAILGLDASFYQHVDVHCHFPEFVRKDGPSAGITMATSMASALTRIPVRSTVAMTGEITLRGRVMPIGGLKEKLLAAHRNGIKTVLIPKENRKDLRDVPRRVLRDLRIVLVDHMDDVLCEALALAEPEAMFGARHALIEYRNGELFESPPGAAAAPAGGATAVSVPPIPGVASVPSHHQGSV